jgi:hypothetical protein
MRFVFALALVLASVAQADAGPIRNMIARVRGGCAPCGQQSSQAGIRPLLGYGEYVVVAGRQFGYAVTTTPPFVHVHSGQRFQASSCPGGNCPLPAAFPK